MKHTKLALVIVLLCGGMLSACKQEAPAPAAEVTPPVAAEPDLSTPDPMVVPDEVTPVPIDDVPADDADEDDTPHSGGDRVGTGSGTGG